MQVAEVLDERRSGSHGALPSRAAEVSVVVSTHGREQLLVRLLRCLDEQDHPSFEVLVVDNGSTDGTWQVLTGWLAATPCAAVGLRVGYHDGPAVPRNTAARRATGQLLAFTDDDCLPGRGWLSALTSAAGEGVAVVQGRTVPEAGAWAGPWGRSVTVGGVTGRYETANLCVRRADLLAVGGFPGRRLLSGRAFGEDVLTGAAVARRGAVVFAPDAVVEHAVLPGSYRDFLRERSRLAGFPELVDRVPELREQFLLGVFLAPRTAVVDVGVAGLVAAAVSRRAAPAAAALPWALAVWRAAPHRPGRPRAVRAAQLAVGDLVGLAALVRGSVRARRWVL